jgi:two-component system response regulator FixJ
MESGSVYVVDGDPAVRDSLHTLLNLNGFQVETFDSGRAFQEHADLCAASCVVCEAQLPDTSGIRLFRWLRDRQVGVPFALLLSRHDPGAIGVARAAGIEQVFLKPLVHRRLVEFVLASERKDRSQDPGMGAPVSGAA